MYVVIGYINTLIYKKKLLIICNIDESINTDKSD